MKHSEKKNYLSINLEKNAIQIAWKHAEQFPSNIKYQVQNQSTTDFFQKDVGTNLAIS